MYVPSINFRYFWPNVNNVLQGSHCTPATNIILNHDFSGGLDMWHPNCCDAFVVSKETGYPEGLSPKLSGRFAVVTNRKECWQGLEQDITNRVTVGPTYTVCAWVGISGDPQGVAHVLATLKLGFQDFSSQRTGSSSDDGNDNIVQNPRFDDGLNNWSGRGCKIVLRDSMADGKALPMTGKFFGSTSDRTENWNGIQQEITGRVQRKLAYEVTAIVRIFGNNISSADVKATLWIQTADLCEQYIGISSVQATDRDWAQLHGKFLVNGSPSRNAGFGVNIISNSNFFDGTNGWFPLGNCTLSVGNGSPRILPPMARDTLGAHQPLSGRYILATNRTETWMGPAQMITDKLKLYLTYQVSAWVRIGNRASRPQNINVALGVDGQWVNGGQIESNDDQWHEIGGSFRIEKQPVTVMVYVQGPEAGVDLMVAGLQIFPVDRQLRFEQLKQQTDKNNFPFGSCISRSIIDNKEILDFFTKNFDWAVFENELKWYWTEPQQGNFNYKDADELLDFCTNRNIQLRGHCIFWEAETAVQSWIHDLNENDMMSAAKNRLTGLLTRYKGKFKHYDVNNEMLHGSFYRDRLGKDISANMFKIAHQLDPSATFFVNDYNIEDGCDARSSPEKYIRHIVDLQEHGAPVGGIGIQGHINSPVGGVVCSALDKLGILGLPIWFTEVDVSSNNEFVRADDLEVMLREAFAHPAVDGVMLWGFWELLMSRENAHLVNAEGDINEAGKRYIGLKQEWLTHAQGHVDEQGQFEFRGFHGLYEVEVVTLSKPKLAKTFVVNQGEEPLVISINL
ncbi:hypothetical protein DH2020_012632 [Rehmannia glutinosa]|uniref:GH10 domain-containing protein n=1 Tax=Rehmannia glutinosa TaxID=99300 RepID=A0ABR0WZY1_REHGL